MSLDIDEMEKMLNDYLIKLLQSNQEDLFLLHLLLTIYLHTIEKKK